MSKTLSQLPVYEGINLSAGPGGLEGDAAIWDCFLAGELTASADRSEQFRTTMLGVIAAIGSVWGHEEFSTGNRLAKLLPNENNERRLKVEEDASDGSQPSYVYATLRFHEISTDEQRLESTQSNQPASDPARYLRVELPGNSLWGADGGLLTVKNGDHESEIFFGGMGTYASIRGRQNNDNFSASDNRGVVTNADTLPKLRALAGELVGTLGTQAVAGQLLAQLLSPPEAKSS